MDHKIVYNNYVSILKHWVNIQTWLDKKKEVYTFIPDRYPDLSFSLVDSPLAGEGIDWDHEFSFIANPRATIDVALCDLVNYTGILLIESFQRLVGTDVQLAHDPWNRDKESWMAYLQGGLDSCVEFVAKASGMEVVHED